LKNESLEKLGKLELSCLDLTSKVQGHIDVATLQNDKIEVSLSELKALVDSVETNKASQNDLKALETSVLLNATKFNNDLDEICAKLKNVSQDADLT